MEEWIRTPLLITIKQIKDGRKANNLTSKIMAPLMEYDGLDKLAIRNKVISFGVDGVQVFKDVA